MFVSSFIVLLKRETDIAVLTLLYFLVIAAQANKTKYSLKKKNGKGE